MDFDAVLVVNLELIFGGFPNPHGILNYIDIFKCCRANILNRMQTYTTPSSIHPQAATKMSDKKCSHRSLR